MVTERQPGREDWFRSKLRTIATRYLQAKTLERFSSVNPLWAVARQLRAELEAVPVIRERKNLNVRWSFGRGVWAHIPWIACVDGRVTRGTSSGVYVIYLFRADMSGVYATLNQGIAKERLLLGAVAARRTISERASELRVSARPLERAGFTLSNAPDLKTRHVVGTDYQHGTIAHRLYETSAMPGTATLLEDLRLLLETYDTVIASHLT